jgi:hypothetical protein
MDIQSAISGTYLTYNNSIGNVDNSESVSVSKVTTLPDKNDSVEISSQTTAFASAVSSVEKEIGISFNRGDPIPPMWLTNEKQIDLIKKMILGKMSTPVDDSVVVKAAESLWKDAGYRVDTLPPPKDTSFGNVFNFLSKQDRKELDVIYNQAMSEGLDAKKISGDSAFEVAKKRMKEVDIANGGVYYDESYITPLSAEDLAKLAEEERIKQSQPKKSESLDTLQKSLSTLKKSLRLNELLLSFLQKNNNQIP